MTTAIILVNVERPRIGEAAQAILDLQDVTEVYSVSGSYDLVAVARVRESERIAQLVTEELAQVQGITKTETLIAFRQYSRHDLERMFGLGAAG